MEVFFVLIMSWVRTEEQISLCSLDRNLISFLIIKMLKNILFISKREI